MQLAVPFFRQPNRHTCEPACLKMLLDYHGMSISFEDIARECRCTPWGTGIESAAEFLASVMYQPTLVYFDPKIHPAQYRTARRSDILQNLKRRFSAMPITDRDWASSLLDFLQGGGIWRIGVLSLEHLKRLIRQKRPVIVNIETRLLWPTKKRDSIEPISHAVLVVGYTADEILFLDPGYSMGEVSRRKNSAFLAAWYFDGGIALYV